MRFGHWALGTLAVVSGLSFLGCANLQMGNTRREFQIDNTWARLTPEQEFLGYRRANRMSPIVLEDRVIQGNGIDGMVAYSRSNGTQIWRLKLENGVEGGAQIANGKLYFGSSNGLFYCVSVLDGKVLWTHDVRTETLAAPTVAEGIVYFQSGADIVYALDAETGKQIWVYNRQLTSNLSIRAATRPVVSGENVYVGFSDGFAVALKRRDGQMIWERRLGQDKRFRDVDATPVVDDGNLYVASFDGALYSLRADTGTVNWSVEEGAYVPVTIQDGKVFYSTISGKILVLDKSSGKILSEIRLPKGIPTQVSFFRGFLVYGESEGDFVVANAENGKSVARFSPGAGLSAQPTLVGETGEAFFISNGAVLYALRLGYTNASHKLPWQTQR